MSVFRLTALSHTLPVFHRQGALRHSVQWPTDHLLWAVGLHSAVAHCRAELEVLVLNLIHTLKEGLGLQNLPGSPSLKHVNYSSKRHVSLNDCYCP